MMTKLINSSHIEGYLYNHELKKKTGSEKSKHPGEPYITGSINIATDEDCLNVIKVYYPYVQSTTSKGKPNATYDVLNRIIEGLPTVQQTNDVHAAAKLRCDSSIGLREWFNDVKDEKPISSKRNEGGFIHVVSDELADVANRAEFKCTMLITNTRLLEANPERKQPEKLILQGYIFDTFRKALLPVEFSVLDKRGITYFEKCDPKPNEPLLTDVRGNQISQTVVREITEEGSWGDPYVRQVTSSYKDFVVENSRTEPYVFGDDITRDELKDLLAAREVTVAGIRQNQENYQKNQNGGGGASRSTPVAGSGINSEYEF